MPEQSDLPQIDSTLPGSSPDENDGVTEQLSDGDTLDRRAALGDNLDEGYVPPDRPSKVDVPTEREELEGESLDSKLAAEVPDVGADDDVLDDAGPEVGAERSGRLVDVDDQDGDLLGRDVGIDGAAASAEEAAVHVVDAP